MQRRHFLYLLIAMLALPPLVITGKLAGREANAQNLAGGLMQDAPSNVTGTRHNFSTTRPTRATTSGNTITTPNEAPVTSTGPGSTTEVCVYCHTPHGANTAPGTPLWNRTLSGETYTPYSSSSLQATDIDAALAAPSKLCLSCHDGTLALGNVANAPGSGNGSAITLTNTGPGGTMPLGRGLNDANHGFTRNLGTDLRNDHPISFTYDANLASLDGELRTPPGPDIAPNRPLIGNREITPVRKKPLFPLVDNKVQCTTCHDPHKQTQKFLNTNRLAQLAPEDRPNGWTDWTFSINDDQICVACHTRLGMAWGQSAHSNSKLKGSAGSDYTYNPDDAAMRDFPTTPAATKVWQAGCLNCHDTHTVAGSRRLLREGSDNPTLNYTVAGTIGYSAGFRLGIASTADYASTSALENTCYQCHSNTPVITPTTLNATSGVPNIRSEFERTYHMPITNNDQGESGAGNTSEVHDVVDKDKLESQTQLGYFAPENRHVECTDCHHPHRVIKSATFINSNLEAGDTARRTHVPARGTNGQYGNIAGGALRGAWGVEPSYTATGQSTVTGSSVWMQENVTFTVKKGDPAGAATLPVGSAGTNSTSYLTREYQLCFKCHSSYANGPLPTDFPQLKTNIGRGGTASGTNRVTRYTDVAKEFAAIATDPPSSGTDQGENGNDPAYTPGATNGAPNGEPVNHRSWHPVVFPTGRTMYERRNNTSNDFGNIRAPFNDPNKVGRQTMHCSDCHGSQVAWQATTGVNASQVQGPHGSSNPFILKGTWVGPDSTGTWNSTTTRLDNYNSHLCGLCHNPKPGASTDETTGTGSGFSSGGEASHGSSKKFNRPCMWCHVAVPHGWRNKALLVNMNCVGPEGGGSGCQSDVIGNSGNLTSPPYYIGARLRVKTWQKSTSWTENSCDTPSGTKGGDWMKPACGDQ